MGSYHCSSTTLASRPQHRNAQPCGTLSAAGDTAGEVRRNEVCQVVTQRGSVNKHLVKTSISSSSATGQDLCFSGSRNFSSRSRVSSRFRFCRVKNTFCGGGDEVERRHGRQRVETGTSCLYVHIQD
ncbi:hypothetical protein EYF80_041817 [Liparis tanakae]|uniref:Uncharacterized protein n=1 Tax=Liparis tanakae TaxID=230148 RepID=A0A4Z2G5D4_9TELE|nr:hypothetical protein EYF80_041817 [Liparis tanakae]